MKTFTLTEQHIALLQRTYVSWDDCEYGAPAIDCKRPYGNSYVERDICDILHLWQPEDEDDEMPDEIIEQCRKLHNETQTALQIILKTKSFQPGTYQLVAQYHTRSWELVNE